MYDMWTIGDGEDIASHLREDIENGEFTTMMKIPRHPDYSKNLDRPYRKEPDVCRCIICGRPCPEPKYMVHEHRGGGWIVTEQEAVALDDAADMGMQAIGSDCLKHHPEIRPYVDEQFTIKASDWKRLYFDLYHQFNGEDATDGEVMLDAYKRFETLQFNFTITRNK